MPTMLTCCLREPFIHFLVLGAMLFGLYELTGSGSAAVSSSSIKISAAEIDALREAWSGQGGGVLDAETLDALIDDLVYQEVMLREALRLGLDRNDTIVRRRLVQKMEFLSANLADLQTPDEASLLDYFEQHRDAYREREKRSFQHIYFSRDQRGDRMLADAAALLTELTADQALLRVAGQGDNFILQYEFSERSRQQVAGVFGSQFAEALFSLPDVAWQGPLVSEYGAHLVRITGIKPARVPALDEIRSRVLDDYMQQQLGELKDENYRAMRARYRVTVERSQV